MLSRCAWEQDDTHSPAMASGDADSFSEFITGWKLSCSAITEMIKTCERCREVKLPKVDCSPFMWADWGLPEWTFPMDMSATQTAAWGAGELFLGMRGSSSFRGMEGLMEKRGERAFRALWRLAAVGRVAVFPKKPPLQQENSLSFFFFFPLLKSNLYPTAKSTDLLWTHRGKKPQITLLSAWNTRKVTCITLKHTRCWRTNTCSYSCIYSSLSHMLTHCKGCQGLWLSRQLPFHSFVITLLPVFTAHSVF